MSDDRRAALRAATERVIDLFAGTTTLQLALHHAASVFEPESLPRRLRARLSAMAEPLEWREVEAILKRAWGQAPAKVLNGIDRRPAALTAASQVHRGEDEDGRPVAVKVRRPGLTAIVRADLALLDAVVPIVATFVPRIDLAGHVREVRERLLDELDLETEDEALRSFARALRGVDGVVVPGRRPELATPDVLVCDWMEGEPLRTWARSAPASERERVAHKLVEAFGGAYARGFVNADPHPDDVLIQRDGTIAIVDLGATRPVDHARIDLARPALDALIDRDAPTLAGALDGLGWLPGADAALAERALDLLHDIAGPALRGHAPVDEAAALRGIERFEARLGDAIDLARHAAGPAEDLWPLRCLGQVGALLARLEVAADWPVVARDAFAGASR